MGCGWGGAFVAKDQGRRTWSAVSSGMSMDGLFWVKCFVILGEIGGLVPREWPRRGPPARGQLGDDGRCRRYGGMGGVRVCGSGSKEVCTGWCQRGDFSSDGLLGSLDPMNGVYERHSCDGMEKPRPLALFRASCTIFLVLRLEQCYAPSVCFVSSWFLDLMAVRVPQLQHRACTERLVCFMSGASR